jgi:NAD(P)-dependent dehydrogenase (short-subunit alcohol dehydrogenase family)
VLALVNNAGVARDNIALQLTDEDWDVVIGTNLSPAFRLTRGCPALDDEGALMGVSSTSRRSSGRGRTSGSPNYAAAQGRPDRHDQDHRRRGRAARGDRQRGRSPASSAPT